MSVETLKERLSRKELVILDGGFGELVKDEYEGSTHGPLWVTPAFFTPKGRKVITDVHARYAKSSDVITDGTFRAHKRTFLAHEHARRRDSDLPKAEMNGITDPADLSRLVIMTAGKLAIAGRKAAERPEVLIAGSQGPLEDCYIPGDTPTDRGVLRAEHLEYARSLKASGVDYTSIETMPTVRESIAAALSAQEAGLAYSISWWGANDGIGEEESFADGMIAIEKAGLDPLYVGINCVDLTQADKALANLLSVSGGLPVAISANGNPDPFEHNSSNNEDYTFAAARWKDMGAVLIGGCCGTRPDTIEAVAALVG